MLKKRQEIGRELMEAKKITKTKVAKKLGISWGMLYYQHKRPVIDEEVRRQIEAVLAEHKAYGHKRIAPEYSFLFNLFALVKCVTLAMLLSVVVDF